MGKFSYAKPQRTLEKHKIKLSRIKLSRSAQITQEFIFQIQQTQVYDRSTQPTAHRDQQRKISDVESISLVRNSNQCDSLFRVCDTYITYSWTLYPAPLPSTHGRC